jgi:hypothetical protein
MTTSEDVLVVALTPSAKPRLKSLTPARHAMTMPTTMSISNMIQRKLSFVFIVFIVLIYTFIVFRYAKVYISQISRK